MKTYAFRVVLERDKWPGEGDEKAVWRAYIAVLETKGVATWGYTREEALKNLQRTLEMTIEDMIELGEFIAEEPESEVKVSKEPLVTVTVAS